MPGIESYKPTEAFAGFKANKIDEAANDNKRGDNIAALPATRLNLKKDQKIFTPNGIEITINDKRVPHEFDFLFEKNSTPISPAADGEAKHFGVAFAHGVGIIRGSISPDGQSGATYPERYHGPTALAHRHGNSWDRMVARKHGDDPDVMAKIADQSKSKIGPHIEAIARAFDYWRELDGNKGKRIYDYAEEREKRGKEKSKAEVTIKKPDGSEIIKEIEPANDNVLIPGVWLELPKAV